MAKFTKSTEPKKGATKNGSAADKAISKVAGGIVKKNKKAQPAVAPAASKPNAVVKAAIIAEAKPKKATAPAAAKQPKQQTQLKPKEKKEKKPIQPGCSVFVGNLPANIKRKTLISLVKEAGKVSSIRFRRSNGAKLFKRDLAQATSIIAFLDLASPAQAKIAAKALNGHQIGEFVLRADVKAGGKNAAVKDNKRTAFIGNLQYNTTDNAVRRAFESCGKIDYVRLNQSKKGCDGTAFVCFKEASSVVAALKLNGAEVNGRPVRVHRSEQKQKESAAKRKTEEEQKPAGKQVVQEEEEADDDDDDEDEDDFEDDDDSEDAASDDEDIEESEDELPAPVAAKKSKPAAPKAPVAAAAKNKKKGGNKKA